MDVFYISCVALKPTHAGNRSFLLICLQKASNICTMLFLSGLTLLRFLCDTVVYIMNKD